MFYVLLLPALLYIIIFCYAPMGGVIMAFKQFRYNVPSIFGDVPVFRYFGQLLNMEWVDFKWFETLFKKPDFWSAFQNTLLISFGRLAFEFPMPIILALILNEMRHMKLKRTYQTVFTFPHFLSWVLVASLCRLLLQSDGTINVLTKTLGGQSVGFLTNKSLFRPLIYVTSIWKDVGWGSIIYLATISGIDPTLYEAATIDGANRWQAMVNITWPSIKPTVVIMLILQCGSILNSGSNGGFDQLFNMINDLTRPVGEIFDTYIYTYAFRKGQNLSLSAAAGLLKSVCNFALLLVANGIAKLLGEEGLL